MIKNLSQLKKELAPGAKFEILEHTRPECVGQTREINIANTQGFYSIIPGEPATAFPLQIAEKVRGLRGAKHRIGVSRAILLRFTATKRTPRNTS